MLIDVEATVLLASCFVIAGAIVLAISAVTYQRAVYESPTELTDQVLDRLGVTREQAVTYLRSHPDAILTFDEDAPAGDAAVTVNAAFRDVQSAEQDAESAVNEANTYKNRVVNEAKGLASAVAGRISSRSVRAGQSTCASGAPSMPPV